MRAHANLFHRDVPGYDVEDVSAMVFGWDDGRIASLSASNIAMPGVWHKEWAIMAERMTGRFTSWNEAVLTRTDGEVTSETIAGTIDPFVAQLADVGGASSRSAPPTFRFAKARTRYGWRWRRCSPPVKARELRLAV